MDRLGLGAGETTSLRPASSCTCLSPDSPAQTRPPRTCRRGGVVAASAGVFSDMSFNRRAVRQSPKLHGSCPAVRGCRCPRRHRGDHGAPGPSANGSGRDHRGATDRRAARVHGLQHDEDPRLPQRYLCGRERSSRAAGSRGSRARSRTSKSMRSTTRFTLATSARMADRSTSVVSATGDTSTVC